MLIIIDTATGFREREPIMIEPTSYDDNVLYAEWAAVPRLEPVTAEGRVEAPIPVAVRSEETRNDEDFINRVYRAQR